MRIKGFTPVIDSIKDDVGGGPAHTYGVMWRYAQQHAMRVCIAKHRTIAERAGIHRTTVIKHQKILEDAGYIKRVGNANAGKGSIASWACLVDISGEVVMGVGDWDVGTSDISDVAKPDTKEKKASEKKDLLDYMVENSSSGEHFDCTWMPADVSSYLIPFGQWFFRVYKRQITKSERGFWIRTARQWHEAGYTSEQVPLAIDYCMEAGTTIKSPASITWAFDQLNMQEENESFSREM